MMLATRIKMNKTNTSRRVWTRTSRGDRELKFECLKLPRGRKKVASLRAAAEPWRDLKRSPSR